MKFKLDQKVKCISIKHLLEDFDCPSLPSIGKKYTVRSIFKDEAPLTGKERQFIHVNEDSAFFDVDDFVLAEDEPTTFEAYDRAMSVV